MYVESDWRLCVYVESDWRLCVCMLRVTGGCVYVC